MLLDPLVELRQGGGLGVRRGGRHGARRPEGALIPAGLFQRVELLDWRQPRQALGVSHGDLVALERLAHVLSEAVQLETAVDVVGRLAHQRRQDRHRVRLVDLLEVAVAVRLVQRVRVLPLEVLDGRDPHGLGIGGLPDDYRNMVEPGEHRGLEPTLAGDQLADDAVNLVQGSHQQRLEDSVLHDARRELVQVAPLPSPVERRRAQVADGCQQLVRLGSHGVSPECGRIVAPSARPDAVTPESLCCSAASC